MLQTRLAARRGRLRGFGAERAPRLWGAGPQSLARARAGKVRGPSKGDSRQEDPRPWNPITGMESKYSLYDCSVPQTGNMPVSVGSLAPIRGDHSY